MNDSHGKILIFLLSFLIIACAENDNNSEKLIKINENFAETQKSYYVTIESFEQISDSNLTNIKSIEKNKTESINYFLVKYDSFGKRLWSKNFEASEIDSGFSFTIDSFGNIYLTSYLKIYRGGITDSILFNMFLTKYNSNGVLLWKKNLGESFSNFGMGVALDSFNNIYVTGFNKGSLYSISSDNNELSFLKKFNPTGIKEWEKKLEILESVTVMDLAVDSSNLIHIMSYPDHDFGGILKFENNDLIHLTYSTNGILQ